MGGGNTALDDPSNTEVFDMRIGFTERSPPRWMRRTAASFRAWTRSPTGRSPEMAN